MEVFNHKNTHYTVIIIILSLLSCSLDQSYVYIDIFVATSDTTSYMTTEEYPVTTSSDEKETTRGYMETTPHNLETTLSGTGKSMQYIYKICLF